MGQASDEALLAAQRLVEDETAQRLVAAKPLTGPALDTVPKAFTRSLAELRCAAAGLAVERHRKKHQHWPKTLEEPVPSFLAAVPFDPYSAKPLSYHQFKEQAIIHSVGPSGPHDSGIDREGPELGFRLWDIPQRRQELPKEDAPTDLGLLLTDYRSYGLPLAPKEAALVRF